MRGAVFTFSRAMSTVLVIAYLLLRGLETVIFMPLAVPPTDWRFWIMGGLYLAAIGISLVAFIGNPVVAATLSVAYAVCGVLAYLLITYRGRFILSDFYWSVPPDLLFSLFVCLRVVGNRAKPGAPFMPCA